MSVFANRFFPSSASARSSPQTSSSSRSRDWGLRPRRRRRSTLARMLAFASLLSVGNAALADENSPRVDLNRASEAQLCTLPGVGPKRAQAIIDFRTRRPFTRMSQLLLVRGIGKKTLRRLRPLLMVTPKKKRNPAPVVPKTNEVPRPNLTLLQG
ncbi:MAG: helix-hairpin-helix domain-containing protein [Deltaproteobacteria bacterium]|nr:helix-hairpin-helix domain-containing protein [Deltaproteobacteria bacterium]